MRAGGRCDNMTSPRFSSATTTPSCGVFPGETASCKMRDAIVVHGEVRGNNTFACPTPTVQWYHSGLMNYEPFLPAKYFMAEVLCHISGIALAIMAFFSFLAMARDYMVRKAQ